MMKSCVSLMFAVAECRLYIRVQVVVIVDAFLTFLSDIEGLGIKAVERKEKEEVDLLAFEPPIRRADWQPPKEQVLSP